MISNSLMLEHLGERVNVILHNGASYWRRLVAVSEEQIVLGGLSWPPGQREFVVKRGDIRSFGTKEGGILQEVED